MHSRVLGWFAIVATVFLGLAIPPAHAAPEISNVIDVIGTGKIDWTNEEARALGVGFAPNFAETPAEKVALAREAAIVAAERNLLKVINGVQVNSESTVENFVLTQDTIRTHVDGLLKGAAIVSEKSMPDGGYQVVLAVNLFGKTASIAESIDLSDMLQQTDPSITVTPSSTTAPEATSEQPAEPAQGDTTTENAAMPVQQAAGYTGLIIDCRGTGLTRSMCPRILDQAGSNLWSTLNVSEDLINERGLVGYGKSVNDPSVIQRVGEHPLTIKALRASGGKVFKTDVVLSPADAEAVRSENGKSLFLDKLNVAFLVDR